MTNRPRLHRQPQRLVSASVRVDYHHASTESKSHFPSKRLCRPRRCDPVCNAEGYSPSGLVIQYLDACATCKTCGKRVIR